MPKDKNSTPSLTQAQIKSDLILARKAIDVAETEPHNIAKYLKGQAGYHLQQAAEKMIKYQIYESGKQLNYSKLYKHELGALIAYAEFLDIKLELPAYIRKQAEVITSWEAEGRYDIHVVVRIDTLNKCYEVEQKWFERLFG